MSETLEQARLRAEMETYIKHEEPICDSSCGVSVGHNHGFSCSIDCEECGAVCHPTCPAYSKE